ncbi:MAG TPA: hypothetical protein VGP93_07175 [Polyangiaceae bacterium]|nr:hypothetical protein [Polyangiaceae bacterium]
MSLHAAAESPNSKPPSDPKAVTPSPVEDVKRVLESPDNPAAADQPQKLQKLEQRPNLATPRVERDLRRLGTQLQLYSEEANRIRVATALSGLGIGSALLPSGLVLLGRTDGLARSVVIGMISGGAAQLLSVPLVFLPTRMDQIYADFMARPISSESEATIAAIEGEWREAAERSRSRRRIVGATLLIVGGTSLATGLTFLLANEGIFGMSRTTQYTLGGVTMGAGVPMTTIGVHLLLQSSLEETSWRAYHSMKQASGDAFRAPSLGVAPLPGGALGFTSLGF